MTTAPCELRPDRAAWRPDRRDAACIALLVAIASLLFLRHVPLISHTHDGFTLTYLIDQGFLGYFVWEPAKEAGRPFIGLPYRLVHDLFGGSVLAYNWMQAVFYVVSCIAVFVAVRLLFPRHPALAWAAAVLKLTWTFDWWVLLNHGLNIRLSEMLFAVSFVALLVLAGHAGRTGRNAAIVRAALLVVIVVSIPIAAGCYQGTWPLIALAPLLVARRALRREAGAGVAVVAWYASFAAGAILSIASLAVFRNTGIDVTIMEVLARLAIGVRAVLIDAILGPASWAGVHFWSVMVTVGFAAVAVALLRRRETGDAAPPPWRVPLLWLGSGLLVVLLTLAPTSIKGAAEWGSRFGYFAIWGWMTAVLALVTLAFRTGRRPAQVGAGLAVCFIVFISTSFWLEHMRHSVRSFAHDQVQQRRIIDLLAGVEEDTIVTIDATLRTDDQMQTTIMRMLSDTYRTYWVTGAEPGGSVVRTHFTLDTVDASPPSTAGHWHATCRFPRGFAPALVVDRVIDAERRVALHWNAAFNQFVVLRHLGNPGRLRRADPPPYGVRLYPDVARWRGGAFVERDQHTVLVHDGAEPEPAFRFFDWYPESCALIAARTWSVLPDGAFAVRQWPISVHVPPGERRRLGFRLRGNAGALDLEHVEGATTWSIPCGEAPSTWRSPPLAPGYHTIQPRIPEGSVCSLDQFVLERLP